VVLVAAMVWDGRSTTWEGATLLLAYTGVVVGFLLAGNR
jgi:Ca2+/H+ antiporter